MKKYFLSDTGDEVEFGDVIVLSFGRKTKHGKEEISHMKLKFIPELADILIENDVITEVESDILEDTFDEFKKFLKNTSKLNAALDELNNRLIELEDAVAELRSK